MIMFEFLPYGTAIGAMAAFVFSAWRYLDTRNRELKNKRFEQFHQLFGWVAGRTPEGNILVDVQQAMAVYELVEFPEYSSISLPILKYYLEKTVGESDSSLFRSALIFAEHRLSSVP